MINLLSTTDKKNIQKGYHLLVLSVCMPILSLVMLVVIISFLPIFILSTSSYQSILAESQSQEVVSKQAQEKEMEKLVSDTNRKITLLKNGGTTGTVQNLFREIINSRPSGVSITNFSYDNNTVVSSSKRGAAVFPAILVTGKAENRTVLLSFVDSLKKKKIFSSVELPLSNLVSGTNLSYTLNIVVAP